MSEVLERDLPVSPLSLLDEVGSDGSHIVIARKISKFPVARYRDGELLETLANTQYTVIGLRLGSYDPYVVWDVTVKPTGESMAFNGYYCKNIEAATAEYTRRLIKSEVFAEAQESESLVEAIQAIQAHHLRFVQTVAGPKILQEEGSN